MRHRGVQQHRQEIVDCAGTCEFVARLQGELDGGEHPAPSRDLRETYLLNNVASLQVAAYPNHATAPSGREWRLVLRKFLEPLDRTETATWHAPLLRHAQRDGKAASDPLNHPGQPERRHAVIRGDENQNFPGIRQEPDDDGLQTMTTTALLWMHELAMPLTAVRLLAAPMSTDFAIYG